MSVVIVQVGFSDGVGGGEVSVVIVQVGFSDGVGGRCQWSLFK